MRCLWQRAGSHTIVVTYERKEIIPNVKRKY